MKLDVLQDIPTIGNSWTHVVLPDKVRESIRIQAYSLGVLEYSFDEGVSFMRTVGTGDELFGNFSKVSIWFRTQSNDAVKIAIKDKLL